MPQADAPYDLSYTKNRELSWLKFNQRVLEEALDKGVPLLERLRFISIFTSNLDEFFMVRVGGLFDLSLMTPKETDNKSGKTPAQQLEMIFDAVEPLVRYRDAIYRPLLDELAKRGVRDVGWCHLSGADKDFVDRYYEEELRPLLSPQIIDPSHPFPHLKNKTLYAAAMLRDGEKRMLGLVGVPESVPPIVMLPGRTGEFVRTEEILLGRLKRIFKIYDLEQKCVIAVTRNADISFDEEKFDEDNPDYRSRMIKLLRRRDRLAPVRLEVQGKKGALGFLLAERLNLKPTQVFFCRCPLKLEYAYRLDECNRDMYYTPYEPRYPDYLSREGPMEEQIRQRDVLLFFPYHSMEPFLALLKESAVNPRVLSIKITIYRLADHSAVVKHLCEAAESGKEVTVLMELRARFDEQNNIGWAQQLEEAGCHIIYGPEGFKCHSKICLITRKEKNQISHITQIGTGNYNENTSALYSDFSLMTADPTIAEDAVTFFQNMLIGDLQGRYARLWVAPGAMKGKIIDFIDKEIEKGAAGRIVIKANSVTDREIIDKLAQASQAGVWIDLLIRGICCLVPGVPGRTEHITVTSIVGRFLEHSRIYAFGRGGDRKIYISSADIMTRNQTRRVEIACPVLSEELKAWFSSYLEILLQDNRKARRLLPEGNYVRVHGESDEALNAQAYFMTHPMGLTRTAVPEKTLIKTLKALFTRWGRAGR